MERGRPPIAQEAVLAFLERKPDRVLDLRLDAAGVQAIARTRIGREISLRKAVERLVQAGRLHRVQAGRYLLTAEASPTARILDIDPVAEAILRRLDIPYYVSWHSALWFHGLVDQQSRRAYVAVNRRKRQARVGGAVIQFVFISATEKFFGGRLEAELEWPARIARPEKAILDSLDRPEYAGPLPVIAEALRRGVGEGKIDPNRLVDDAIRFDSPHLNRRLGFFMDLLEIPGSDPLLLRLGRGYAVPLEPGRSYEKGARPSVSRRWRIYEDPTIIGTTLELK